MLAQCPGVLLAVLPDTAHLRVRMSCSSSAACSSLPERVWLTAMLELTLRARSPVRQLTRSGQGGPVQVAALCMRASPALWWPGSSVPGQWREGPRESAGSTPASPWPAWCRGGSHGSQCWTGTRHGRQRGPAPRTCHGGAASPCAWQAQRLPEHIAVGSLLPQWEHSAAQESTIAREVGVVLAGWVQRCHRAASRGEGWENFTT